MTILFKMFLSAFACAMLLRALPVLADAPDYHDSPADDCISKLGNAPTNDAIIACFQKPTKRSNDNNKLTFLDSVNQKRNVNALALGQAICTDTQLPKNFYPVDQVKAMAGEICAKMASELENKGACIFQVTYNNGTYKSGNELHGNGKIVIRTVLSLSPPAFRNLGNAVLDIVDFCENAIKSLATENSGCTKGISGYNAGKARTDHVLGTESGWFPVNALGEAAGVFAMSFIKP
jgi:hypothetical protein